MATRKTTTRKTKKSSVKSAKSTPAKTGNKSLLQNATTSLLNRLNIILAVLLAAQAVALVILSKTVSLPVNTHFITIDSLSSQAAGHNIWAGAARHLFDINIAWLLAVVLLATAVVYALNATRYRKSYETALNKKTNPSRAVEYIVSGGLMLVALGLFNGIYDLTTLLGIVVLVEVLALFSLISEVFKEIRTRLSKVSGKLTLIAALMPWLAIAIYLFGAQAYGTSLPAYVYWLDGTIFAGTVLVSTNMFLGSQGKGRWTSYLFTERNYMILGFAVKTAIVWQVFFGILR